MGDSTATPAAPPVPHRLAVRRLMRGCGKAALATRLAREVLAEWPYASLVTTATAHDGSPVLLLSGLADHTRNAIADPRVSLLFDGTDGFTNPQQGPRVTVLGRIVPTDHAVDRRRFLARHPEAEAYADFADFRFWRMNVLGAHFVGGFARAVWIPGGFLIDATAADRMAEAEAGILARINREHPQALDDIAARLPGGGGGGWRLAGVDADGCDLVRDGRFLRMQFAAPVDSAEAACAALVG